MRRILIADDNEDFVSSLKLALESEGYAVQVAANGREALALQQTFAADVLITDLVMPEKDGFETLDAFRAQFPATLLFVVSGAEKLDPARYLQTAALIGAHATFRKPFRVEALLGKLRSMLS